MTERIELAAQSPPRTPRPTTRGGIGRFMVVGAIGAVLNTAVLYLLNRDLHLALVAASMLATELAVANNYVLNNRWTFPGRPMTLRRFAKFNASSVAGVAINVIMLICLAHLGVNLLMANLIGIAAGFAVNFYLSSNWVWAGTK